MKVSLAIACFICIAILLAGIYMAYNPDDKKMQLQPELPNMKLIVAGVGFTLGLLYIGVVFIQASLHG